MGFKCKEKKREWQRNYMKQYNKEYKARQKNGYHNVYLLEDYNYVGCTSNLINRFAQHKSKFGRDCKNYKILFQSVDRDEALRVEAQYHEQGYEGKHINNRYH